MWEEYHRFIVHASFGRTAIEIIHTYQHSASASVYEQLLLK